MKHIIALAVFAGTTITHAASDRAIYDIMYLPNSGTTFGFSELGYIERDVKVRKGNPDLDISGWGLSQTLGHSLTDRLAVTAEIEYVNAEEDPETGKASSQRGISDPVAKGRFRLMDEDLKLDLLGGLLAGIGKYKQEADGDSNNLRGGNAVFGGAQVGQKNDSFQWAFSALLRRNFERKLDVKNENGKYDIKYEGNSELQLTADILNKLSEESYLRSHVTGSFAEGAKPDTDDLTGLRKIPAETTYEIGTEYQHLLSGDLMLRGGLRHQIVYSDSARFKSDRAWVLLLGANYQF